MTERYQFSRADGHPDWTVGNKAFDVVWDHSRDLLRFHRGKGFTITERPGKPDPMVKLEEVHDLLEPRVTEADLDTVFEVRSLTDRFALLFRRHEVSVDNGLIVLTTAQELIGTPYVFGVTDCSWLTMHSLEQEGIVLPHKASLQHSDPQVVSIKRPQIKPGDLLFHHDDEHVSLYLDDAGEGRVIDTEPHDAPAPGGGMLGTGVRVRPMNPGYYCDWEHVDGIGRIVAINGQP